jgi:hypothetical protein
MTLRIYLPYGAHLRFEGVSNLAHMSDGIQFTYTPRDPKTGLPMKGTATARFFKEVICGFSVEEGA